MGLQSSLLLVGACIIILVALTAGGKAQIQSWLRFLRNRVAVRPGGPGDSSQGDDMAGHMSTTPADWAGATGARASAGGGQAHFTRAQIPETPPRTPLSDLGREYAERFGEIGEYGSRPDQRIDFIIHLPLHSPVERDSVLGIYRQNEYTLDRPHALYGRHPKTGRWSNLERDPVRTRFAELALAIQLADAKGAVSESELNGLASIAVDIADQQSCRTVFLTTFEQALEWGRELDRFCRTHDLLASINILSNSAAGFGGRAIDQAAHRIGMQYGVHNIYHMIGREGSGQRVLFSLANLRQPGEFDLEKLAELKTPGVILFMIVPCVPDPGQAFARLAGAANSLCRLLDGRSADQEGRALTPDGLKAIRVQVDRIAVDMRAYGIPPGSETAVRLFGDVAVS